MPHYFFHVREGESLICDPEGSDLPNEAAARAYAVAAARSLLSTDVLAGRLPLSHAIEVADEGGRTLLIVAFGEAVTPA